MGDLLFIRDHMKLNKVEGLILTKRPYKERDLICDLLLRSGKKITVVFYGGQGGGRNKKSSLLEIGYLIKIELQKYKRNHEGIYHAKEFKQSWVHEQIRLNHHSFYLLCFFVELTNKLTVEDDLEDVRQEHHLGFFRLLSNAVFYLEDSLTKKQFHKSHQLSLFLSKLIFELGISPNLSHCLYSEKPLDEMQQMQLLFEQGGFVDPDMMDHGHRTDHRHIWQVLKTCWTLPYKEYLQITPEQTVPNTLFHYLVYQTQLSKDSLKTVSTIF